MDAGLLVCILTRLYSLILVGFFLARTKIFDAHVNRQLSTLVATGTYSLLLLCSMMEGRSCSRRKTVLLLAGEFAMYLLYFSILPHFRIHHDLGFVPADFGALFLT